MDKSHPVQPGSTPKNSSSRWIKGISTHGNLRGVSIQATDLIREMAEIHGLRGMAVQSLGEAVIGALLIGSYCKTGERVNLNIQGRARIQQALVDAYPDGTVRGYVIERTSFTDFDEAMGPWGEGLMSVLRTKGNDPSKRPYIGTVPLLTGHLAKDLTFYWVQSEQIPSSVGIVVNLSMDGSVDSAGGFLIQAMPGATPDELRAVEQHIMDLQSLGHQLALDPNPLHLLSKIFQSTPFVVLEEKPLEFRCTCSWERVERALSLVGVAELRAMLKEDKSATVHCDFCAKEYKLDEQGLERLIEGAQQRGPASSDDLH